MRNRIAPKANKVGFEPIRTDPPAPPARSDGAPKPGPVILSAEWRRANGEGSDPVLLDMLMCVDTAALMGTFQGPRLVGCFTFVVPGAARQDGGDNTTASTQPPSRAERHRSSDWSWAGCKVPYKPYDVYRFQLTGFFLFRVVPLALVDGEGRNS